MKSFKIQSAVFLLVCVLEVQTYNFTNETEVIFENSHRNLTQIFIHETVNYTTYKFSHNKISKIHIQNKSIYNLKSIKTLLLDNNKIINLDLDFLRMFKNLLFLDVSNNYIKVLIYPEKALLNSLKAIDISHNLLNSLYFSKKRIPNLRTFNVSGNPVTVFDIGKKKDLVDSKLLTTIDLTGAKGWEYCEFLQNVTYFWLSDAPLEYICDFNKYNESCFKNYAVSKFLDKGDQKSNEQTCIEDYKGLDPFVYFLIVLGSLIILVFLLRLAEYVEEYHRRQRFLVKDDIIKIHMAKLNRQLFEAFQETGNPGVGRLKTVCRIERGSKGGKQIRAQLCTTKPTPIVIKHINTCKNYDIKSFQKP